MSESLTVNCRQCGRFYASADFQADHLAIEMQRLALSVPAAATPTSIAFAGAYVQIQDGGVIVGGDCEQCQAHNGWVIWAGGTLDIEAEHTCPTTDAPT